MSTQSSNQVKPAETTAAPVPAPATPTPAPGDKIMAKSMSPMSQAAAVFQSLMPPKSMYSASDAGPCEIYRQRNGIMSLTGGLDDSLMSPGGMYVNKVAQNAQTFGAPACGASKSSCGSISEMMAKMQENEIAALSPSDRNSMNTFSALSIARLSKAKEQKDQAAAVSAATDAAVKAESAPKVGAMMDSLAEKASAEASDIVKSETVVKRDFLGRPCAPGTYDADMYRESYKKMLRAGMDLSMTNAAPALTPTPMFASLRDSSAVTVTAQGTPAAAPAAAPAPGATTPSPAAVASVDANMARVSEALATDASAPAVVPAAAAAAASTDNAGQTPLAYVQSLSWPWIAGIIALSLLAVLMIAGLIYWLVGSKDKPQGVVGRTVAAAGNTIGRGVDAVKSTVKGILGAGEKALTTVAEGTVNAGEKAFDTVKSTAGATLDAGATALGAVGATGGKLLSGDISGAGQELVQGVKDTATGTLDIAKTAGSGLVKTAGSVIDTATGVASAAVDAGSAAVGGVADLAKGTVQGGVDVAKAITNADESASASDSEASSEPAAAAEESSDQSVGVDDINQAFAKTEQPADATEDLKARTDELEQNAKDILNEASDASADVKDAADEVKAAMGDQR